MTMSALEAILSVASPIGRDRNASGEWYDLGPIKFFEIKYENIPNEKYDPSLYYDLSVQNSLLK